MIDTLRTVSAVSAEEDTQSALDPRILSSILVSVKLSANTEEGMAKDPHARLLELMHSSPVRVLLDSATLLAKREGISPQDALQQIVVNLKEIDQLWSQVLLKEGLARLSSQFH
jgi:hypothetical protein